MSKPSLYIICFLLLCLLVREGCHCVSDAAKDKQLKDCMAYEPQPVKVMVHDTLWRDTTIVKAKYVPKPYAVAGKMVVDTFCQNAVTHYRDTLAIPYGSVVIDDKVQGSRIISREPTFNLSVPTITKTLTVPQKKRNEVYAGFGAVHLQDGRIAAGPTIAFKTKRDVMYSVGGAMDSRGRWMAGAGVRYKLSFRKK